MFVSLRKSHVKNKGTGVILELSKQKKTMFTNFNIKIVNNIWSKRFN